MRALHATVKDKGQPATARQQATRTLLEVLQVIGAKAKERPTDSARPNVRYHDAQSVSADSLEETKRLLAELRTRLESAGVEVGAATGVKTGEQRTDKSIIDL